MDQVHVIRHKVLVEGLSQRRVAREMGVSRITVRRYVEGAQPAYGPRAATGAPVRGVVGPRIEELLADSARWTGGKQRLTARRLHQMLRDEGFSVGVTTVKELVAEHKRARREVFVPLVYQPGDLAEVDFFEVLVYVAGERRKAFMFVMRLMSSGRDFAWLYQRQDQIAFLDGHVRAFAHFGGVPHRLAYDNLRAAVTRILVGGIGNGRELAPRFLALSSHYLFEACFCRPRTGHDKGGVEARGKGIRWQHLVPIPSGRSLGEISRALMVRVDGDMATRKDAEGKTVAERFAVESARFLPLAPPFDAFASRPATVTRTALVSVEGALYSVPSRWAGLDVTVRIHVDAVEIIGKGALLARHPRRAFGQRSVDYRHYLPELAKKPQAVRQVAAELLRDLGEPFAAAWRSLVDEHGPRQAARIFAKVLGHAETRGIEHVAHVLRQALGSDEPLLLALAPPPAPSATLDDASLPAALRGVEVDAARASDYDALLAGGVR